MKSALPFGSIERSLLVVPLFAVAGAAAGSADAALSELLIGKFGSEIETCAWIGGGIGLGIGVALAFSYRWWIGLLLAPILGMGGYLGVGGVSQIFRRDPLSFLVDWDDEFLVYLADVAAFVLVGAHLLFIRLRRRGMSLLLGLPYYAVFGAISGSVFWYSWESRLDQDFWMGLLNGAVYGLLQYAALLGALAFTREDPERR